MLYWLKRLFKNNDADKILKYPSGKRYYRDFHPIRKTNIDEDAVKVINRLSKFGYRCYAVGGCVRDLLLEKNPKDYDIVTNAHPSDVRKIFGNSRVIGRRFRIVHIVFRGNKIIEVSTARSLPKDRNSIKNPDDLYLQRDNEYGTFKEDAARRDFTINSLFFDLRNETIIDYTGGYEDLQERIVRVIGDESISLPEDPVRMLRAVKFSALLNFELHSALLKGIRKNRKLINKASRSRLHEEFNKIFRTGESSKVFSLMVETGLFDALFSHISKSLHSYHGGLYQDSSLHKSLMIADRMIQEHEDINLNIYYAILVYPLVRNLLVEQKTHSKTFHKKIRDKLSKAEKELGLSKKIVDRLVWIFENQSQFSENVNERKAWVRNFKSKDYFLESFIFYKINSRALENDQAIQRALFWEIGLRKKLPNAIRRSTNRAVQSRSMTNYINNNNEANSRPNHPQKNRNYKRRSRPPRKK